MNPFEKYLRNVLNEIDVPNEEKDEMYHEFLDHLTTLQAEFIARGFSESKSALLAVNAFGDFMQVGKGMERALFPYKLWVRRAAWIGLTLYTLTALHVLLFSDHRIHSVQRFSDWYTIQYNLVPFESIAAYLLNFDSYNFDVWFFNTFGNILVFLPLGIFLPVLFPRMRTAFRVIISAFSCSLAIELIQFVTWLGQFDVDDLILNAAGAYIGYAIWSIVVFLGTKAGKRLGTTSLK